MKQIKRLLALALAALLALSLCSCAGDQAKIRGTLNDFQTACRALDLNEMLDCFDSDATESFRSGLTFVSSIIGQSPSEMLDAVVPFLFGENYASSAFLSSITIRPNSIAVADDAATAMCTVSFLYDGETVELESTIRLVREGDGPDADWYIANIRLDH